MYLILKHRGAAGDWIPSSWKNWNRKRKFQNSVHDNAIKQKHFPRYWTFVRGIHRSPVDSLHKDQWRGSFMFSLIYAWTNGCANHCDAGDLRRHRTHYDVTVMWSPGLNEHPGITNLCSLAVYSTSLVMIFSINQYVYRFKIAIIILLSPTKCVPLVFMLLISDQLTCFVELCMNIKAVGVDIIKLITLCISVSNPILVHLFKATANTRQETTSVLWIWVNALPELKIRTICSCINYARQTREIYQVLPYSVNIQSPGELYNL